MGGPAGVVGCGSRYGAGVWRPRGGGGAPGRESGAGLNWKLVAGLLKKVGI